MAACTTHTAPPQHGYVTIYSVEGGTFAADLNQSAKSVRVRRVSSQAELGLMSTTDAAQVAQSHLRTHGLGTCSLSVTKGSDNQVIPVVTPITPTEMQVTYSC